MLYGASLALLINGLIGHGLANGVLANRERRVLRSDQRGAGADAPLDEPHHRGAGYIVLASICVCLIAIVGSDTGLDLVPTSRYVWVLTVPSCSDVEDKVAGSTFE
jgi:hypothetical protein